MPTDAARPGDHDSRGHGHGGHEHAHGGQGGPARRNYAILTSSDAGAAGERADTSGDAIRGMLDAAGFHLVERVIVPDDRAQIAETLRRWSDGGGVDLVLTTGGTGLGPRDVTPEATLEVIEMPVPGIAEAMRAQSLASTHSAMLSRAVAGVRRGTLIINLPGSPRGVRETLEVVLPVLGHAIDILAGRRGEHPQEGYRRG